jgi:hypothetical protein
MLPIDAAKQRSATYRSLRSPQPAALRLAKKPAECPHVKFGETTMTRLAILGFALAVFATPVQADSQKKFDAPVYTFNGNVFDPPSDHYAAAESRPQRYTAPKATAPKAPGRPAPLTFNGMVFD